MAGSAEIGIFGGSGFYEWLTGAESVTLETPFGAPSGPITLVDVGGRRLAFLARHGSRHQVPAPVVIDVDGPGRPFDAGWASAEERIAARRSR